MWVDIRRCRNRSIIQKVCCGRLSISILFLFCHTQKNKISRQAEFWLPRFACASKINSSIYVCVKSKSKRTDFIFFYHYFCE